MTSQFIVSRLLPDPVFDVSGYLIPRKLPLKREMN